MKSVFGDFSEHAFLRRVFAPTTAAKLENLRPSFAGENLMTTFTNQKMRGVAILTGGVLAASALFHPAPAQADEKKDKTYKAGAAALGVLGAYFILKGKTVPGAIAGAGAYYAYKKSKDAKNDDRYSDDRYNDDRYSDNYYSNDDRSNNYPNNNSDDYYADDYYSRDNNSDNYYSNSNGGNYDGSWSTPASNRSTNNRNRDGSYSGIAPSTKNGNNSVVLK